MRFCCWTENLHLPSRWMIWGLRLKTKHWPWASAPCPSWTRGCSAPFHPVAPMGSRTRPQTSSPRTKVKLPVLREPSCGYTAWVVSCCYNLWFEQWQVPLDVVYKPLVSPSDKYSDTMTKRKKWKEKTHTTHFWFYHAHGMGKKKKISMLSMTSCYHTSSKPLTFCGGKRENADGDLCKQRVNRAIC